MRAAGHVQTNNFPSVRWVTVRRSLPFRVKDAVTELRPWTAGELLDRSVTLWRRRVKPLFQVMIGFQLALFLVGKAFTLAAQRLFPGVMSGKGLVDPTKSGPPSTELVVESLTAMAAFAVFFLVIMLISWSSYVAINRFVMDDLVGQGGDRTRAWARVRKRFGTMVGVFFVVHLWAFGVFVLSLVPGVVVMILAALSPNQALMIAILVVGGLLLLFVPLAAMLWYLLRFMLVPTVIAIEERGVFDTIRRSGALLKGRVGPGFGDRVFIRATVVLTVIFVVLFVVVALLSLPAGLIQIIYGNILNPGYATPEAVPQWLLIPAELFEAIGAALLLPLSPVLAALFYLDMRMRREGLDLELKLNAIEASKP